MTNHVHMSLPDVTSLTHTNGLLPAFLQRWWLVAWLAGCALAAYNYLKLQLIPIRQYIWLLSPPLHSCTIQERISFSATSITLISQKSIYHASLCCRSPGPCPRVRRVDGIKAKTNRLRGTSSPTPRLILLIWWTNEYSVLRHTLANSNCRLERMMQLAPQWQWKMVKQSTKSQMANPKESLKSQTANHKQSLKSQTVNPKPLKSRTDKFKLQ